MTTPFIATTIVGADQVQSILKELPRRTTTRVTKKAVNAGARIISREAKRLVRRGKTNQLSRSIGIKGKQSKSGYYAKIGSRRGFAIFGRGGKKYDPTRVVHLVEKGTQPHIVTRRGLIGKSQAYKHPGARPNPFIAPALNDNISQVQSTVREKLWSGIQEEAKKS